MVCQLRGFGRDIVLSWSVRTTPARHRPHTDVLRGLHVPLRLQLGARTPRGRAAGHCPAPRVHLLRIHGQHDDRLATLHVARVLVRARGARAARCARERRTADAAREAELARVCGECGGVRGERGEHGRVRALLGVLHVRGVCGHVLPDPGHAARDPHFE